MLRTGTKHLSVHIKSMPYCAVEALNQKQQSRTADLQAHHRCSEGDM